ncbi:FAD-dependent oxidoreductase [Coraliomargarita algicola]|uniref:FAD-dependent oxidoreductase n=1 Tax=Coraliomargarita algicola TaxID=3092156 RepID=A0ABZ0RQK1_9BACT|nr:FAD-dependent oxidoreductase [Coraliomargarita sp. J2-16]WPJ95209.1 FAD-dependent oxidoreductase [Coraliomargarita sp. J2-16]
MTARRYRVEVDFGTGTASEQARAYSSAVDACWVPTEYRHQMALTVLREPSVQSADVQKLMVAEGLLALTESARLAEAAETVWLNPIAGMCAAEAIAPQVFEALPVASFDSLHVSCAGAQALESGEVRTLRDALRPGAVTAQQLAFDPTCLPVLDTFDVVVAGGGTGGAPAAISAARAGARTLVVEVTSALGGVGTMGQIATYWCGNRVGFTAEIDAGVKALETKEYYQRQEGVWSVAAKCQWYHKTGYDLGCTYWLNTLCVGTVVEGDRVTGLIVAGPYGYGLVHAGCIVDSTGCSDIPAAAGAPTCVIGKEHVAVQGTGLAGMKPGREYHNSDHNFSDDTDVTDATAFFVSSKLKFKDDFDCGELVDSRERRQIVGDCSLSPVDILMNRRSSETICVATSNFDSHGFTVDPVFMLVPPNKDPLWADIPFGCFLPQGLDGVLVTGLGVSAHRDALPVIRMQADVQNQGYAAGLIAARSAEAQCPVRAVDLGAVQRHLVDIGGLPERVLTDVDNFPVDDATLQHAIEHDWDTLTGVSLMLNEGARSLRLVGQAYSAIRGQRSAQSLRYAQVLAQLGDASAQAELIAEISDRDWDDGWRFQGMHQFGKNMSELDSLLVCLGCCGDAEAWPCLIAKLETLPEQAAFSHIRALAMSIEALQQRSPNGQVAPMVAEILNRKAYRGHAQADLLDVQSALSDDINENKVRDHALRELHLARLLYRCGDYNDLGRDVLREYASDCRGHFARHAKALLEES